MKQKRQNFFRPGKSVFLFVLIFFTIHSIHAQENITLNGKVVDKQTKLPLAGATVHIKNTTHEVVTSDAGEFHFLTGQRLPVTYIITYVGYHTVEITQTENENFSIQLEQSSNQLSDVVVVGYGKQRRSDVTGSIATVSSK